MARTHTVDPFEVQQRELEHDTNIKRAGWGIEMIALVLGAIGLMFFTLYLSQAW